MRPTEWTTMMISVQAESLTHAHISMTPGLNVQEEWKTGLRRYQAQSNKQNQEEWAENGTHVIIQLYQASANSVVP